MPEVVESLGAQVSPAKEERAPATVECWAGPVNPGEPEGWVTQAVGEVRAIPVSPEGAMTVQAMGGVRVIPASLAVKAELGAQGAWAGRVTQEAAA